MRLLCKAMLNTVYFDKQRIKIVNFLDNKNFGHTKIILISLIYFVVKQTMSYHPLLIV